MTLKQKQERLRKLIKQKEQNQKNWKRLEDHLGDLSGFSYVKKIKKAMLEMQDLIMGKEAKA